MYLSSVLVSSTTTRLPSCAARLAATSPAMPAPMMMTSQVGSVSLMRSPHISVMRGLDPRIPLRDAPCSPKRDGRDEPGHDDDATVRKSSAASCAGARPY